jgi:adenylate kinase family enzyme
MSLRVFEKQSPNLQGIVLLGRTANNLTSLAYNRIIVIGTTSSGKSTLAERIAKRLDMDFIELDALHWEPGWQEAPLEVFRVRVETAIKAERWIVAGNYHVVRDLIWPKAEAVIWLDYSLLRIFWQLTCHTFKRWWTQEPLWGTNRERLWVHFKLWSQESLFHWLFKTYWRRKRETPELLALPEHRHLKLIRFKHPRESQKWLKTI